MSQTELFDAIRLSDVSLVNKVLSSGHVNPIDPLLDVSQSPLQVALQEATLATITQPKNDSTAAAAAAAASSAQVLYSILVNAMQQAVESKDSLNKLQQIAAQVTLHITHRNPLQTNNATVAAVTTTTASAASTASQVESEEEKSKLSSAENIQDGDSVTTPACVARIENALSALRRGDFIVVTDDENRENEGDLIIAAEKVTSEKIAFMVNETSGLLCVGITDERCKELDLPLMVEKNSESFSTAFTVSVDYKHNTTTGISASDRALTIQALAAKEVVPSDFNRPGHVFPLKAKQGGVLVRPGHTEASVDLTRLAGLYPAGALCEIVKRDGSMFRPNELSAWAQQHGLVIVSIADLIEYRKLTKQ